ncbi:MAG: hypothetical protein WCV90_07185 [Candidatus Woesearchaeota archaeon]|jgi:hypothetical protein
MTLILDPEVHKAYHQTNAPIDLLTSIFCEGREPMFISDIMQRRLDVNKEARLSSVRKSWWDIYPYTGDVWLKNPKNGRAKILCNDRDAFHFMQELVPRDKEEFSFRNATYISDTFFEEAQGLELTAKEVDKLPQRFTYRNVKRSRIWQYLAGSQERLEQYVEAVLEDQDLRYGRRNTSIMGLNASRDGFNQSCSGQLCCISDLATGASMINYTPGLVYPVMIGISPTAHAKRE